MKRIVLAVDDSKIDRTILSSILSSSYEVKEASNGKEALEMFDSLSNKLSAIVLDLLMPDINGLDVIKAIVSRPNWRQIPIIVASGERDIKTHEEALKLGAVGFVEKPYNKTILLQIVKNAVSLFEMAALSNAMRHDKLTGLYNRLGFLERAEILTQEASPSYYCLSLFNIENFKLVNDQYGTSTGDEVLKLAAKTINNYVTGLNEECVVARLDSDKFLILLPRMCLHNEKLRRFYEDIRNPSFLHTKIRFRLGRVIVDDLTLPLSAYLDRAALAEKSIKHDYGSFVAYYDDKLRQEVIARQKIVTDMLEALRNQEFVPYFQPQINHATGKVIGAEALVRWIHKGKVVPPNDFIPVFEQNGFIFEMDQAIWEKICQIIRAWLDENKDVLPISVNVSRYDLMQENCPDILIGLIEKYGIPVDLLRLEITESTLSRSDFIMSQVNALIDYGFTFEIDDFGSGYSSLNIVKDIRASILKLDMRFFEDCENETRASVVIQFVVRLAKWLNMIVVAEGVETLSQANYLKSIGCFYIQGFLYSKPLPLAEYEEFLANHKLGHSLRRNEMSTIRSSSLNDPKSLETWIFETQATAACILEIRDSKTEVTRINNRYASLIAERSILSDDVLSVEWNKYMDEESKAIYPSLLKRIKEGEENVEGVLTFVGLPNFPAILKIKTSQSLLGKTSDSIIVYCAVEFL